MLETVFLLLQYFSLSPSSSESHFLSLGMESEYLKLFPSVTDVVNDSFNYDEVVCDSGKSDVAIAELDNPPSEAALSCDTFATNVVNDGLSYEDFVCDGVSSDVAIAELDNPSSEAALRCDPSATDVVYNGLSYDEVVCDGVSSDVAMAELDNPSSEAALSCDKICKGKDEAEVWFSGLKALISRGQQWKWRTESRSDGIPSEATSPRTYTRRSSPLHSLYGSGDVLQKDGDHLRHQIPYESSHKHGLEKAFSDAILYAVPPKSVLPSDSASVSVHSIPSRIPGGLHGYMRVTGMDAFRVSRSSVVSPSSQGSSQDDGDALRDVFIWGEGNGDGILGVVVLTSRTEVYTWGKGTNGHLGHGDTDDRNSPTLLEALKDKQVKSIACGTNFTVCLHKWESGVDQSMCSGCHLPFSFERKRHNCYNCGLVFSHSCSSRKSLKASMAPNPNKHYRVRDICFGKLNKAIEPDASSQSIVARRERMNKGLNELTEKDEKLDSKCRPYRGRFSTMESLKQGESCSFERNKKIEYNSNHVSPPDGSSQWGALNISKSFHPVLGSSKKFFSAFVPRSRIVSLATSPLSRQPSPPRSTTPTPTLGGPTPSKIVVDDAKRRNDSLDQEVTKLKAQVENLTRNQLKEVIETAIAGEETAKCRAAKEVIKSLTAQICKDKDEAEVWLSCLKALISRGHQRKWRTESMSDSIPSKATSRRSYTRRSSPLHSPYGSGDGLQKDGDQLRHQSPYESSPKNGLEKAFSDVILYDVPPKNVLPSDSASVFVCSIPCGSPGGRNGYVRATGRDAFGVSLSSAVSSSSQGSIQDDGEALGDVFIWGEGIGDAKRQVENLTRKAQLEGLEFERSTNQLKEAIGIAIAGEETAECKAAKEVIKSLTAQVFGLASVVKSPHEPVLLLKTQQVAENRITSQADLFSTPKWVGKNRSKKQRVQVANVFMVSKHRDSDTVELFDPRLETTTVLLRHGRLRNFNIIAYNMEGWLLFRRGRRFFFFNVLAEEYIDIPPLRWQINFTDAAFSGSPTNIPPTTIVLELREEWAVVSVYSHENGWRMYMIEEDFISREVEALILFRERFYWLTDDRIFCCSVEGHWVVDLQLEGFETNLSSFVVREGQHLFLVAFNAIDNVRVFRIIDRGDLGEVVEVMLGDLEGLIYTVGLTSGEMVTSTKLEIFAAGGWGEGVECIYFDLLNHPKGIKDCSSDDCECGFAWVRFGHRDQPCRVSTIQD